MGSLATALKYWHTLKHLRPVQFYGRLWFRFYKPKIDLAPAPARRQVGPGWVQPPCREASLIGPTTFKFLGVQGSLDEVGWEGPQREKLWRYNQHYFDDLNALAAPERATWHQALLLSWQQHNPPGRANAWEPYPTSLRIVNWVKWCMAGGSLPAACEHSLAVQTRWLRQRMEHHLLGNHLFANAKALVFAGLYFDGEEAQRWLKEGLRLIQREIREQILEDGGHFERSTMYHALALEDLLDLCNLTAAYQGAVSAEHSRALNHWQTQSQRMLDWLLTMRHPDGEISFFNDAALGIAPSINALIAYAHALGLAVHEPNPVCWLRSSGYARLKAGPAVLLVDMAPVGPDYLPGHAHADTLSFEWSLHGQRVLVNSGTDRYGASPERLRQRGTAAHNTVVVDGTDSSEVWHGFRVARRARLVSAEVMPHSTPLVAQGAHNGYQRLPGKPVHQRRWELAERGLRVIDLVQGPFETAEARYHFHPDVELHHQPGDSHGTVLLPGGQRVQWRTKGAVTRLESSSWHPRFGVCQPSTCLVVELDRGQAELQLAWTP